MKPKEAGADFIVIKPSYDVGVFLVAAEADEQAKETEVIVDLARLSGQIIEKALLGGTDPQQLIKDLNIASEDDFGAIVFPSEVKVEVQSLLDKKWHHTKE